MILTEIRSLVADRHAGHPQRHQLAQLALDEVERGLAGLAALGHSFELGEAQRPALQQYPKVLYHDSLPPVTVANSQEASAYGVEWRETIQAPPTPAPAP